MKELNMHKRKMLMAGVAAAAGLAGAGVAWWRLTPEAESQADSQAFWQSQFDRPEGGALSAQDFKGRPLLLNFWATWCPPCVEELPLLESIWRENKSNGFQIVGLAIDQPSSVRRFLAQNPLTFPIGLAGLTGTELGRSLGNSVAALPFSVLFDARGQVLAKKMGKLEPHDLSDWLLKVK